MARKAAIMEDFLQVALARSMGQQLASGNVKYTDVACVMLHCLGVDAVGTPALTPVRMRNKVKEFVAEQHPHSLGGPAGDDKVSLGLLPAIFKFFCDVDVSMDDVRAVASQVGTTRRYVQRTAATRSWEGQSRTVGGRFGPSASAPALGGPPPPLADAAAASGAREPGPAPLALALPAPQALALQDAQAPANAAIAARDSYIYDGLSLEDLKACLLARDERIVMAEQESAEARKEGRLLKKQRDYWFDVAEDRMAQIVALNEEQTALLQHVRFRHGVRGHVSLLGGYTLALRRNVAHAGAAATAAMVAGDDLHGNVKDPRTVWKFEHKAAAVIRLRARAAMAMGAPAPDGAWPECAAICIRCDATHQEAIDKEKVHVSQLLHLRAPTLASSPEGAATEAFEKIAGSHRVACDLQVVREGTAKETYANVKKELASVGCPTWEDARPPGAARGPCGLSVYVFGVDAGPDNVGMAPMLTTALSGLEHVAFVMTFCCAHQAHLVILAALQVLEGFDWGPGAVEPAPDALGPAAPPGALVAAAPAPDAEMALVDPALGLPAYRSGGWKYWSSAATVANVWRSAGSATKLRDNAARLYDDAVAQKHFGKMPGRPLKGRWGRVDSIEGILRDGRQVLGPVFNETFQAAVAKDKKARESKRQKVAPGEDEEAAYVEKMRNYRAVAVRVTNSQQFLALVLISHQAKAPVMHFFHWMQKQVRVYNARLATAEAEGRSYMGPTPLSGIIATQAASTMRDLGNLLTEAAWNSEQTWGGLWPLVPNEAHRNRAAALIVRIVLALAASWKHRFVEKLGDFPYLLLRLVESPPEQDCPVRRMVAQKALAVEPCCLLRRFSDVTAKWVARFQRQLDIARRTGACPPELFSAVLLLRAAMPVDTQEIEGMNSILQVMASRAANMRLPLASDRMQIKKSQKLSAYECLEHHEAVVAFADTPDALGRFDAAPAAGAPAPAKLPNCPHKNPMALLAARYALSVHRTVVAESTAVWDAPSMQPFLVCWSYGAVPWVAMGRLVGDGLQFFQLAAPLVVQPLRDLLVQSGALVADGAGGAAAPPARSRIQLTRRLIVWQNNFSARVLDGTASEYTFAPAQKPPRKKAAGGLAAASGPQPLADAENDAGDDSEVDLEGWLEFFMEAEGDPLYGDPEAVPEEVEEELGAAKAEDPEERLLGEFGDVDADEENEAGGAAPAPADGAAIFAEDYAPPNMTELRDEIAAKRQACFLAERRANVQSPETHPMKNGVISLIEREDRVQFVRWEKIAGEVRPIHLDELQRVKTVLFFDRKDVIKLSEVAHRVLIRDTGVEMRKTTGGKRERPPMEEWALLLKDKAEIRAFCGPYTRDGCKEECVLCHGHLTAAYKAPPHVDYYKCRQCLTPWHRICAKALDEAVSFDAFVCHLCELSSA